MSLTLFEYQKNNIRFENRNGRVWVCLTDMAKASGKLIGNWNKSESTKEFLNELESIIGFGIIQSKVGGNIPESERGTWAIEEVAIEFAGWCSVQFKIWMLTQIKTLLTQGYVALIPSKQLTLSSRQLAVETAKAVDEIQHLLSENNPRLTQFLIDYAISDIMPNQKTLTGDRFRGVAEIANDLGYKVDAKNRSLLGKFVKARCEDFAQQEERLVNGTIQKVFCYPEQNQQVISAINLFFS